MYENKMRGITAGLRIETLWRLYCKWPHSVCCVSCRLCLYFNIILFSTAGRNNSASHHFTIDSVKTALLIISQAAVRWSLIAKTCSRSIRSENLYSYACWTSADVCIGLL